jgi:hypothetical protein
MIPLVNVRAVCLDTETGAALAGEPRYVACDAELDRIDNTALPGASESPQSLRACVDL